MNFFRFCGVSFHTFDSVYRRESALDSQLDYWHGLQLLTLGLSHRVNSSVFAFTLNPSPASEHAMWGAFRTCRALSSLSRPCISKDTMNVALTKDKLSTYKVLAGLLVSLRTFFLMESRIYL